MKPLLGFSLIEVLTSLLLLALILLGVDAMQMFSLRENRNAYYFSVAENQLNSMVEQLGELKSPQDLSQLITIWNQENHSVLPLGKGYVMGNFPNYKLTIFWGDKTTKHLCSKIDFGKLKCLTTQIVL